MKVTVKTLVIYPDRVSKRLTRRKLQLPPCSLSPYLRVPGLGQVRACMLRLFSHVWLFATLCIFEPMYLWPLKLCSQPGSSVLSRGFSRQEYLGELPCPPLGDFSDPGIESGSPALQAASSPLSHWGRPLGQIGEHKSKDHHTDEGASSKRFQRFSYCEGPRERGDSVSSAETWGRIERSVFKFSPSPVRRFSWQCLSKASVEDPKWRGLQTKTLG